MIIVYVTVFSYSSFVQAKRVVRNAKLLEAQRLEQRTTFDL